jgi:ATP-dependent RNA helicase SUPV3L1/SUV3
MNLHRPERRSLEVQERAKGVLAVLGPTNTGKTHLAIERMLNYSSGIIGLPLRLLAREVYNRVVAKVGVEAVALITGEEKIKPKYPRYWISTIEAMPRDISVAFVAIDEIQLAGDLDRGHTFTNRLLNMRGREETLILGAATMAPVLERLLPGITIISRPRLSNLTFAGDRKLTRLAPRSAIVAFSAEEVYAIAELMRRQKGGVAVVLGALSPRTRNAQVDLYQNGDVDYIIATDAIGMGLNLDVEHVAFAADKKFDGWQRRRLTPAEMAQIAGRAGRHIKDGTFGTTGRCLPFTDDIVEMLTEHRFDPVNMLQWRNADLDFSSLRSLQASLEVVPEEYGLTRAPVGEDILVLDIAARDESIQRNIKTRSDMMRLWECCQIPDYRKVSPAAHADLSLTIFNFVVRAGRIPDEWFSRHLTQFDRVDGDIDTLSARIAQVRTLTYIANRPDWLIDPEYWQGVARQVEDRLSDALHERLTQRFVDRRTSLLMRRLRENAMLAAEITASGDVKVEDHHVGHLEGFRFTPDPQASGEEAKALNAAAHQILGAELEKRAAKLHEAVDESLVLSNDGTLRWLGEVIGKLTPGDKILEPRLRLLADEQLTGAALDTAQTRITLWMDQHIKKLLGPLFALETGEGLEGIARGIAFQIAENLGVLERAKISEEMKVLDQDGRSALRKAGVRFGAYHIYLPATIKPAPRALAAQLWALKNGGTVEIKGLSEVPHLASSGRTSFAADKDVPKGLYRAAGFRLCGERCVRVDILERLADLIRPAINYRPGTTPGEAPSGSADNDGFVVTVGMTSLAGCSGEDFAAILRSLGYVATKRSGPAMTVALLPLAPTTPVVVPVAEEAQESDTCAEPVADTPVAVSDVVEQAAPVGFETAEAPATHEAPTDTLPEPEVAPEAPAVEPVLIEVWHLQRHHHRPHHPRPERGDRRPTAVRMAVPAAAPSEAGGEPATPQTPRPRRADHFSKPAFQGKRQEGGKPQDARPQEGRPPRDGQRSDGKRFDNKGRDERHKPRGAPFASTEAPKTRDKQPDPDSPFAKLLALKAAMEQKKD